MFARGIHVGKELLAQGAIGKIEFDAFERAVGALAGEARLLELDDMREVDLDPAQRRRQVHAIGPGVEAGAEIDDSVDAAGDRLAE